MIRVNRLKLFLIVFFCIILGIVLGLIYSKIAKKECSPFPHFPEKYKYKVILTSEKQAEFKKLAGRYPKREAPKTLILCFNDEVLNNILSKESHEKYFGINYLNDYPGVAIASFGMTAPLTAMRLDKYIEWGIKKVIAIGTCCSLQKFVKPGDIVVCNKALRDEGTSHHYLPYSRYAYPSKDLVDKLIHVLNEMKLKYIVGPTLTTDGFYRLTKEEVAYYQKEGILTLEMEAAALFAVAEYRKIEMATLFSPTDSYANLKWEKAQGYEEKKLQTLNTLFEVALKVATVK